LACCPLLLNAQAIDNGEIKKIFKSNIKGKTHSRYGKGRSYESKGVYKRWLMSGLYTREDYLNADTLVLVNFLQGNSYGWALESKRRFSYYYSRGRMDSVPFYKNKWQIKKIKGKTFVKIYEPAKNIFGRRNYLECFEVLQIMRGMLSPRRSIPVIRATFLRCDC